ncbi:MAG: histidine--tRNA ligase [Thaumarchaeota archaeon]|nr:histidine--tRNA ligase [Nitrososphaerota archaeon]MCL5069071.1 histidine--tRNA ligase [Nitrososphaerota archaeon]
MDFSLPRGLRDVDPEEEESAEIIRTAFLDTCRLFDYKLMEPSSLELLHTLEAKSGPAIRDEIYHFKDKSERDLGLRFDLTVGMTRYVASRRELSPPIRLAAFSSVWRYDEPQYGKYRWFYQWDAELFGPSNTEADAEIIEFASVLFRKLGTRPTISIGSRRVLESFVRENLKIQEKERILDAMRAIDKLEKKAFEDIVSEYSRSISEQQFKRLVDFVKLAGDTAKVASSLSEFGIDSTSLLEIIDSLKSRGITDIELNLSIVRGIDYYTDMVFEAFDRDNRRLGALCGGGRYDSLPSVYGRPDLGATGVAGGVERAMLAYKFSKIPTARVFVAPVGDDPKMKAIAASIAAGLRSEGIAAQSDIAGRSLRKILESQSSLGTRAVVIVGKQEIAQKVVKVKWMSSGEEENVAISELKKILS